MIRYLIVTFLMLSSLQSFGARQLLEELDFNKGKWVMIAVSLHNYHLLPIQKELGTFIIKDRYVMNQIKRDWIFEEKFDDFCAYHYAIKFYHNGELVKTLRANLLCNYISVGGLSYHFDMSDFVKHRRYYVPIKWSRIRFEDIDLLQEAVHKIDGLKNVYWYGDVKQYEFNGSFMLGLDHLHWRVNRDSVVNSLTEGLAAKTGREDFYVQVYLWYLSDDMEEMTMRFDVHCSEAFFEKYKEVENNDAMTKWRDHLSNKSFVQIVVIGMSKKDYFNRIRKM